MFKYEKVFRKQSLGPIIQFLTIPWGGGGVTFIRQNPVFGVLNQFKP